MSTEQWSYTEWDEGYRGTELYDLKADPRQTRNLSKEPQYAEVVARLAKVLHASPIAGESPLRQARWAGEAPKSVKNIFTTVLKASCFVVAIAAAWTLYVLQARGATPCVTPDRSEILIPGGTFLMGSDEHGAEEGPVRRVTVESFSIDRFDVTNAQFAKFIAATGYVTDAERRPNPKDYPEVPAEKLRSGGAVFKPRADGAPPNHDMEWWELVEGADWRHPTGPKSSILGRETEPVVQVSYRDALAYAHWVGRELPTEEQYEYAARGGFDGKTYAWGNELKPGGKWRANVWQGHFPERDIAEDGYKGVAPVGCFPPNSYGLYDMVGNVWKWTASLYSPQQAAAPASRVERVIKGGSFMCSSNYCQRFRPAARQPQESAFSSVHLGFRTVSNRQPMR